MTILPLIEPTGRPELDRVLAGVVGLVETVLPGQMHSYYLVGSHADGTALAASDLDLVALSRHPLPPTRAAGLRDVLACCSRVSPVPVDAAVLAAADAPAGPADLRAGRLLYGTDARPALHTPDPAALLVRAMAAALEAVGRAFGRPPPVPRPLAPPDPGDPWLGLVRRPARQPDGSDQPGLRGAVDAVVWPARALTLWQSGRWEPAKGDGLVEAYRAAAGGRWAGVVEFACRRCRAGWGYRVPADPTDRTDLRAWCHEVVGFADAFLADHRRYRQGRSGTGDTDPTGLANILT